MGKLDYPFRLVWDGYAIEHSAGEGRNHNNEERLCVTEEESIGNFINFGGSTPYI